MERKSIPVTGMSCSGCERNVESALKNIDGVTRIDADHGDDTIEIVVDDAVSDDDIAEAIRNAGYDVPA